MGKGIKKAINIVLSTLSVIVMTLIIVPIVLSLLLNLEPVQNWAIGKVTGFLSRKAETTISIEHISLRLFTRVSLDGVYIEDYHGDTLFYAKNITASFRGYFRMSNTLSLGDVKLDYPEFNLMQDSTGLTNLRQILERVKNPDRVKKGNVFRLNASSLRIDGMAFNHRKRDFVPRDYGVNFTDIGVERFDFRGDNITVVNDSIHVDIDLISIKEKSGLEITSLSSDHFTISGSGMWFYDMRLKTPESDVSMNRFSLEYGRNWLGLQDFINDVRIGADIVNSTVAFPTIAYFAPSLQGWESVYRGFTGTVSGTVADLSGHIAAISIRNTSLSMDFAMNGIPDIDRTKFDFEIAEFSSGSDDIEFLYKDITRAELGPAAAGYVRKLGNVTFAGSFDGYLSDFAAAGILGVDQGSVDLDVSMEPGQNNGRLFSGTVSTTNFDLGDLLDEKNIEDITFTASASGTVRGKDFTADATASVPRLTFNGYTYRDMDLKGLFQDRAFDGHVASADPNMSFVFDGKLDLNDTIPFYNFDLDILNADLYALKFNRRDTVSLIKTSLMAWGSGFDPDIINGDVTISQLTYINHVDTVETGQIRLVARNDEASKMMGMYSDFADMELRGSHSYNTMFSYLSESLFSYLPSLSGRSGERRDAISRRSAVADASGYYVLTLDVKEANNVAGIFVPGLHLAEGTSLSFLFNPDDDRFSLNMNADFIERGSFFVSNLNVTGRNDADSLSFYLRSDDLFIGTFYMPNFSTIGGAKNNTVSMAARFSDTTAGTYALLSTVSTLFRDGETGIPRVRINFRPSTFTAGSQTWNIGAQEILIDSTAIAVDTLKIANGPQELLVYGVASGSMNDTLHVQLNNFDLTPVSRITSRQGYELDGTATGHADMVSALREGLLTADIGFEEVEINGIAMPNTTFASSWDFQSEQVRLNLTDTDKGDTIAYGYYAPDDKRYLVHANFDSLHVALLNPFVSGFLRETQGYAKANITLSNPDKKLQIDGSVGIASMSTVVDYTNVKYSIRSADGEFRNNVLTVNPSKIYDPEGNGADLEMTLNMQNLSNITYNVRIRPERSMVLNTTINENELFYGRIYASGLATITGDKRGVNMNIEAATENNSTFYMPLGGSATASMADFIQFVDPRATNRVDTLSELERRRMQLRGRLDERSATTQANMDIRMTLTVRPNTELEITLDPEMDNVIRGRGSGTLNIHVNQNSNIFTMYGNCDIVDGSYRFSLQNNLLTKNFTIMEGSNIQWTGDPADAMLNVTGVYNVKASLAPLLGTDRQSSRSTVPVECVITLTDRLTRPDISFDVQVPNADAETRSLISNALNTQEMKSTQFLSLLVTNSFLSDGAGSGQNLNIGSMATAATGFDFLSNQLSRMLSTDRFNLVPKYRPRSDVNSDEIGLAFSAELIKDRLTIEVDGNYDTGNNINMTNRTANQLTGDVYINLLLDQAGGIRARAFTRTIDRFDENQGLQESGIGLSYKEDFNNAKDLWTKIRNRFRKKDKKNNASAEEESK